MLLCQPVFLAFFLRDSKLGLVVRLHLLDPDLLRYDILAHSVNHVFVLALKHQLEFVLLRDTGEAIFRLLQILALSSLYVHDIGLLELDLLKLLPESGKFLLFSEHGLMYVVILLAQSAHSGRNLLALLATRLPAGDYVVGLKESVLEHVWCLVEVFVSVGG